MRAPGLFRITVVLLGFLGGLLAGPAVTAAAAQTARLGPSGLPLPRFVSLKSNTVNVREGPGEDYRIAWVYVRAGLPVEVTQEFDTWRRIRDADGSEGWVSQALLSGDRTAVVAPWEAREAPQPLFRRATVSASVAAYLEPGVLTQVSRCSDGWCNVEGAQFSGWMPQDSLWGVYPGETVE